MINDGIRINGKHSYEDFGLYISGRTDSRPKKKSIRETVPFFSGFYDFSAISGEVAWESRELTYTFDVVGGTPAEAEAKLSAIMEWLLSVHDADIFDDTIPGWHYRGSFDTCSDKPDGSGLATELEVTFICQPFKVANQAAVWPLGIGENTVVNNGRPVIASARSEATAAISVNGTMTSLIAGVDTTLPAPLQSGINKVTVTGAKVALTYSEVIY